MPKDLTKVDSAFLGVDLYYIYMTATIRVLVKNLSLCFGLSLHRLTSYQKINFGILPLLPLANGTSGPCINYYIWTLDKSILEGLNNSNHIVCKRVQES